MDIKILRIIARLNIGGPARNAVLLTEGLSGCSRPNLFTNGLHGQGSVSNNWETVLVCGEVGENEGDMGYFAREKGIAPLIVPELGRELSFINDWQAFWKIYKIICKEKPDIVHTHTAKAGTLGRLAALLYNLTGPWYKFKGKRCKVIHTFHGHVLHSYFGKVKTCFFIWIEKILALFTDKIITVSSSLKKELVENFRIAPEKKFSVVELGFELNELLRLPARGVSDCINIGIVGRLVPVKNHRMLLRVAKKIEQGQRQSGKREIAPVWYIVIGDGELREELENYAKELEVADIVEFKGWIKDLRKIYEDLDIVVLTSLNEGTPVSVIEAMAAARPVVATEVGGVKDVVQDQKNGYLARPSNESDFTEKLLDLIKDSVKSRRFGGYGRGSVRDRFSKERLLDDIDRLYNELLEEGDKIE
jgi:glycosyltransferase involved in cell wall biosynthesis